MDRSNRLRPRWQRIAWAALAGALVYATACRAEISFQSRQDVSVGSGPTAITVLATAPPTLLVANSAGLNAFRYDDGSLAAGARSFEGRGAQLLVSGPFGPGGANAIAYGSREAPRLNVAAIDARGALGNTEQLDLPALPRAVRSAVLSPGTAAAIVVAHDDGLSLLTRGAQGWQRRELAAPRFARDVGVGDLNGDGRADLVVVDETTNRLNILHGSGDGAFSTAQELATVRAPTRAVIADVNGDGYADVLVVGEGGLAAHAGQADGTLSAAQTLRTGGQLVDVGVADVNGDGRVDLALLDRSRSTLSFLLGGEQGQFLAGDSYLVGYGAETAVLADLDGDGQIDALTLNRLGDDATLLRGRGGGRFDGIVCLRSEIGDLTAIVVDDFNRDDLPDLAITSEDGGRVQVFLGTGDGRFRELPAVAVGRQPRAIVAGDFNQDGAPDLAVVNFGGDAVAILLGDGQGGFSGSQLIRVGTGPTAISIGSFGNDTIDDLAIVNSLSDSVSVLYGDGRGAFPTVTTIPVAARPSFLIVGDTNSDGHQDLVVGSQLSESVTILLGDGHQLGAPTTNTLKGVARPSQAEDFNHDGEMDLVNPEEAAGMVEVLPGTGDGKFGTPIRLSVGRDPHAVATGDFDRDGRVDIAVLHRATQTIAILLNRTVNKPAPTRHGQRAASKYASDAGA